MTRGDDFPARMAAKVDRLVHELRHRLGADWDEHLDVRVQITEQERVELHCVTTDEPRVEVAYSLVDGTLTAWKLAGGSVQVVAIDDDGVRPLPSLPPAGADMN